MSIAVLMTVEAAIYRPPEFDDGVRGEAQETGETILITPPMPMSVVREPIEQIPILDAPEEQLVAFTETKDVYIGDILAVGDVGDERYTVSFRALYTIPSTGEEYVMLFLRRSAL